MSLPEGKVLDQIVEAEGSSSVHTYDEYKQRVSYYHRAKKADYLSESLFSTRILDN